MAMTTPMSEVLLDKMQMMWDDDDGWYVIVGMKSGHRFVFWLCVDGDAPPSRPMFLRDEETVHVPTDLIHFEITSNDGLSSVDCGGEAGIPLYTVVIDDAQIEYIVYERNRNDRDED